MERKYLFTGQFDSRHNFRDHIPISKVLRLQTWLLSILFVESRDHKKPRRALICKIPNFIPTAYYCFDKNWDRLIALNCCDQFDRRIAIPLDSARQRESSSLARHRESGVSVHLGYQRLAPGISQCSELMAAKHLWLRAWSITAFFNRIACTGTVSWRQPNAGLGFADSRDTRI